MNSSIVMDGREADAAQPRTRHLAWAISVGAHVVVLAVLFTLRAEQSAPRLAPIVMGLVELPDEEPPGPPDAPAEVPPATPVAIQQSVQPTPMKAIAVNDAATAENDAPMVDTFSDVVSESQLAGAASASDAGTGGGGAGGCDMANAVQRALRRDPMVRTALQNANRLGKSIMLWDGDWVRAGTQDGKGLSGIREAIMWEVAFAPEVCRTRPMQGLVMLSLDDSTRFAIGSSAWRWSDLLGLRK